MRKDIGLWRWLFAIIRLDRSAPQAVYGKFDLLVVVVVAGDVIVSVNVFVV